MKEIKKYLDEEREGNYSFVFEDLDSEYVYKYNSDKKMTSAGTMKLMLAVAFLKKVEEGKFSMDELVPIKESDKKSGSGILREFVERNYTIKELITVMLVAGDNTATYKLMQLLDFDNINTYFKEMGLNNTILTKDPGVIQNVTTTEDLAKVIRLLYKREYLNEENSSYIIELLRQRVKSKIAFYLDNSLRDQFASKTGDTVGVENEVALINNNRGNFVFAIMSEDLPNSVYGMVSLAKAGMMLMNELNSNWKSIEEIENN